MGGKKPHTYEECSRSAVKPNYNNSSGLPRTSKRVTTGSHLNALCDTLIPVRTIKKPTVQIKNIGISNKNLYFRFNTKRKNRKETTKQ